MKINILIIINLYNVNKSQRVGTLNNSFDFLFTNDETGTFGGVAKTNDKKNITLNTSLDLFALLKKYSYNTNNGNESFMDDLVGLAYKLTMTAKKAS
ncbi:hypothetical protein [Chryseobacterium chendengshani]|uniref:hypothetical protein n=1 Tax=Chryseobacterium sp. LJ756 TaxID=2864113 RepID=UPI001C63F4AC|nr:hypothetical protein [Chryseobacterium sp. LJ756]MBW7674277.1 hypothetical protein [Chryseobacterium sp. LJ756]